MPDRPTAIFALAFGATLLGTGALGCGAGVQQATAAALSACELLEPSIEELQSSRAVLIDAVSTAARADAHGLREARAAVVAADRADIAAATRAAQVTDECAKARGLASTAESEFPKIPEIRGLSNLYLFRATHEERQALIEVEEAKARPPASPEYARYLAWNKALHGVSLEVLGAAQRYHAARQQLLEVADAASGDEEDAVYQHRLRAANAADAAAELLVIRALSYQPNGGGTGYLEGATPVALATYLEAADINEAFRVARLALRDPQLATEAQAAGEGQPSPYDQPTHDRAVVAAIRANEEANRAGLASDDACAEDTGATSTDPATRLAGCEAARRTADAKWALARTNTDAVRHSPAALRLAAKATADQAFVAACASLEAATASRSGTSEAAAARRDAEASALAAFRTAISTTPTPESPHE